ncbi:Dihydrolipoamide dehydrogenase [Leptospira biflexa serovar Patoc strain 'Patoc 1 (Ames)']|uniref:Dihydrolipoyl dehydrogenase n=1 Tax=Leptospira biflexa serovar Patoc (strain Patoc 1 / ATCC 23582 / Paris) TaxID=456481 RepID=B0SNX6_LEPBP|nr:dihydrolipoyl dehydrogenase [Leptospira biflexa]ABZ95297.1 Dihydrolipoamide dehydrogenase [Leptospira biflexa serovar Patoc strain 'Patoc 1 (Ames)']ABZ98988.1 Dihydrolipoyl dehydrogenase (E3 component of alpha keto acid dehydrogenase complexes; Dihydrolipoamide dehydrogenase) [Leptospira biflexa serovar Patoc strain 'Patoc 1 (Paris)']
MSNSNHFQVIVIGGGPGGYVAAIRAAQLGLQTCVVERDKLGGVCLNWGCIPTKALLESAHVLEHLKEAAKFGISADNIKVDFDAVIKRSRSVADQMAKGVEFLMKKNKVTVVSGEAKFLNSKSIEVKSISGEVTSLTADYFILAVGAKNKALPFLPFDGKRVLSAREAMVEPKVIANLAIIGAGAIGVEFADFYASMGSKVSIIEFQDHLLPNEDKEISSILERSFKKRGIEQYLSYGVETASVSDSGVLLTIQDRNSAKKEKLNFDKVIVGVGISPNTNAIGLDEIGVKLKNGFVEFTGNYRSTVDHIYAIGDCIPTPSLAHVASAEGIRAAEDISVRLGNPHLLQINRLNYSYIPGCTYCHPEVASVGLSEDKAKAMGHELKIGKFPFSASGRAQAQGDTTGMVKIVSDAKHGEILGAHIIGPGATELIAELTLGANMEITVRELANTIHAHPTLAEGIMESAAAVLGEAINI